MFIARVALLVTAALPAFGGYIIPVSQRGAGLASLTLNIPNYTDPGGQSSCSLSTSGSATGCTLSIISNDRPSYLVPQTGTSSGTLSAYTDAKGGHIVESGSGSGSSQENATAQVSFGDTEVNNTSSAEKFQITFHLDAEFYTLSTAFEQIQLTYFEGFNQVQIFSQMQNGGGSGIYTYIHQDITTPIVTVAANSSFSWSIDMTGTLFAESASGTIYPAGLPQGLLDAGNTLSMTQFSVFDLSGNALPQSALTSSNGFDYTSSANAPEPASLGLAAAGLAMVALFRKRI